MDIFLFILYIFKLIKDVFGHIFDVFGPHLSVGQLRIISRSGFVFWVRFTRLGRFDFVGSVWFGSFVSVHSVWFSFKESNAIVY